MLGALVATMAAGLAGATNLGAKGRGHGKAKGKSQRKDKKVKTRVSFCHLSEETGAYKLIAVAEQARRAHEKHGDVECVLNPCEGSTEPCTVVCSELGACVAQGAGEEDPVQE
jgi:hypothetical protein